MTESQHNRPAPHEIELAAEDYILLLESRDEIIDTVHNQIGDAIMGDSIPKHLRSKYPGWEEEDFQKFAQIVMDRWPV